MNETSRRRSERGFSLFSILVYGAIFAIMMNFAMTLFIATSRLSAVGNAALQRVEELNDLSRSFTRAVGESRGAVATLGEYKSNEKVIILRMPESAASPGVARYRILGELRSDGTLSEAIVLARGAELELTYFKTFSVPSISHRFILGEDPEGRPSHVTLEIEIENEGMTNTIPTRNTFVAAFRSVGASL